MFAQSVPALEMSGAITYTHDPSRIIKEGGKYWVYSTAENINTKYSTDLETWTWADKPFDYDLGVPDWLATYCNGSTDASPWNVWAPDIIQVNSKYFLFYSRNCPIDDDTEYSVMGVATSTSPSGNSWTDQGEVVSLELYTDYHRAIDPAPIVDQSGNFWVAVGSFGAPNTNGYNYGGIWVYPLSTSTGLTTGSGTQIARRWIEAPYLTYHDGYYYLFFNQQTCCLGTSSDYYIRVGRSTSVNGTYTDMNSTSLLSDGGSLFMGLDWDSNYVNDTTLRENAGEVGKEIGPGHVGIYTDSLGIEIYTYHYYDATNSGTATMGLRSLIWGDDGWPRMGWDVVDGVYSIGSTLMGLSGASGMFLTANSAPQFTTWSGSNLQLWKVARVGTNQYSITNLQTGTSLYMSGASVALGSYSASNSAFKWNLKQANDRSFTFYNVSTGTAMTVPDSSLSAVDLEGATYTNALNQRQWLAPAGFHRIQNQWSGLYANVSATTASLQVTQTALSSSDSLQIWNLTPTTDGYTAILNVQSGLAMTVNGSSSANDAKIIQSSNTGTDYQKWSFELLPDSSWRMVNKATGKIIDNRLQTSGNGAIQRSWLSTRDQQWALTYLTQSNATLSSSSAASSSSSGAVVQGEDFCTADGVEESTNTGYYGDGYLNGTNAAGASATWYVQATTAGDVDMVIRYANGGSAGRPVAVLVNGDTAIASLSMASTGSFTTWFEMQATITLATGRNEMTWVALDSNGMANIDQITFNSATVSTTDCEETSSSSSEGTSSSSGTTLIQEGLAGGLVCSVWLHQRDGSLLHVTDAAEGGNVRLYDTQGRLLLSRTISAQTLQIEASDLAPGLVVVQVRQPGTLQAASHIVAAP